VDKGAENFANIEEFSNTLLIKAKLQYYNKINYAQKATYL
jgi:hypothetical protein